MIGTNVELLSKKENLIFIVIVIVAIGLLYWKLPTIFPQLFQLAPDISESIKSTMASIFGG